MKTEIKPALSKAEQHLFTKLDTTIKAGAQTFLEVGQALVEVHKSRLYRVDFPSFEAYTESRGISRGQAYKLMTAVQMSLEIEKCLPRETRQTIGNIDCREKKSQKALLALAKVPKAKRLKVLKKTLAKGNLTERAVLEVAAQVTRESEPPKPPEPEPVAEPRPKTDALTPKQFERELAALAKRIPDEADHEQFGIIANRFATVQMNWKKKTDFNPYSSRS